MNAKHEAFAHEYTVDRNGTQAAIRAGYAEGSAKVTASRLLTNANVAALVHELTTAQFARAEITGDAVLAELGAIAFSNMNHFARWGASGVTLHESDDLPELAGALVAEVSETVTQHGGTKRLKLHDKLGALALLLKRFDPDPVSPRERAQAIRQALDELEAATIGEPPDAA